GSYLPSSSYCLQLSPQRVKDLANFILNFFNDLPEIAIVCMNFLEDGKLKKDLKANFDLDTDESILKLAVECSCECLRELEFLAEAILTNGCYTSGLRRIGTDKLTLIYNRIREVCRNVGKW
nr:hypothetical protein [Tanacetum cinerariifolium]